MKAKEFQHLLYTWYEQNPRDLPWLEEKNPYFIWISEIILQQTRSEQAIPYYKKFITLFPTLAHLAQSTLEEVLHCWQGLGYYTRAKNLWYTANFIQHKLLGKFPMNYKELLQLKGIGSYTAAAISSFAYNEAQAVIDGNVIRLITRLFLIEEEINTTIGKKLIEQNLHLLFDNNNPAKFNQAIMNFGAMYCKPKSPDCQHCPFQHKCNANKNDMVYLIPYKKKKSINRNRYFHYLVFNLREDQTIIHQRIEKDIWQKLFEFPMIETKSPRQPTLDRIKALGRQIFQNEIKSIKKLTTGKQVLSHQNIHSSFYLVDLKGLRLKNDTEFLLVKKENLSNFAFPKTILVFLEQFSRL